MIKVRRIGHTMFETNDLDRLATYYTDVIGLVVASRDKDRVFLASKLGPLAVELRRGSQAGCRKLAFEIAPDLGLADMERELSNLGIKSARSSDPAPGVSGVLSMQDPQGTEVELFTAPTALVNDQRPIGVGVEKLGHVAHFAVDLTKTIEFYTSVLGFRISDWIGDFFVFMRCNPDHHTVNFLKGDATRLHHIAFQLNDWSQIKSACDLLGKKNIDIIWGPLRHGPGHNIAVYHRNPDDQIVELFCELDTMPDEELGYFEQRPWHRDNPQRPKVWPPGPNLNIWGPPASEEFRRR